MLPVIITGENQDRLQYIGRSMPLAQCVPLRSIRFDQRQDSQSIPALAAPSIVLLDVESEHPQEVSLYIKRFKMTYPNSAVLAMVGFGDTDTEQVAIDSGADDVLTRPASVSRMSLTLRNLSELVNHRMRMSDGVFGGPIQPSRADQINLLDEHGALKRLHHIEQEIIQFSVNYCHGHISNTAKALGIGRSTLYRKLDAIQTRLRFQSRVLGRHEKVVKLSNAL